MTNFIKDPCGIVCITITYLAIFYADYVVTRWIILQTMQNRYVEEQNKHGIRWHRQCFPLYRMILINHNVINHCSAWGPIHVVLFNTVVFLLAMSHLKAVFSDPGTVPLPQNRLDFSDLHSRKNHYDDENEWTVCTRCETYRPPRAHHCRICKRCVR